VRRRPTTDVTAPAELRTSPAGLRAS